MKGAQLQYAEPIEGTTNVAAGERAKAAGMADAARHAAPDWSTACDAAIELMAKLGTEFQAADLVAKGLVDEPDHPSQWGPRFQAAANAGVIEPAGVAQSKRATVRRSLCHTWRGRTVA